MRPGFIYSENSQAYLTMISSAKVNPLRPLAPCQSGMEGRVVEVTLIYLAEVSGKSTVYSLMPSGSFGRYVQPP